MVSAQMQLSAYSAEARAQFARLVAQASPGRTIPDGFQPKKPVLASLLKDGTELTPDTLFPFSQVTLAHTATMLRDTYHIDVEVIGVGYLPA
ncbi:DUF6119 family protein [Nonomuraea sp. NPDC049695]|uniref:DUF6119 family protein n=1 Tax=Nonomuraea sp. NPDC049695 TaxID=3154734 RepID=UPI00343F4C79